MGLSKVGARLLDFRFFVHDLTFLRSDGTEVRATLDDNSWQARDVALLDFQDRDDNCGGEAKPTNAWITGTVADDQDIVALRFRLGLPNDLNHADPAKIPLSLNETSMYWSWQSGYKSMRIDVSPEGGISRPSDPNFLGTNYFFHLGSTDCRGDPLRGESVDCARVNQPLITLSGFRWNASQIKLDFSALVSDLDLNSDDSATPGCMSDLLDNECRSYFEKLGLDLASGRSTEDLDQVVFSVE